MVAKRAGIAAELQSTEATFRVKLELVVNEYQTPLMNAAHNEGTSFVLFYSDPVLSNDSRSFSAADAIITVNEVRAIFSSIEVILGLSKVLRHLLPLAVILMLNFVLVIVIIGSGRGAARCRGRLEPHDHTDRRHFPPFCAPSSRRTQCCFLYCDVVLLDELLSLVSDVLRQLHSSPRSPRTAQSQQSSCAFFDSLNLRAFYAFSDCSFVPGIL